MPNNDELLTTPELAQYLKSPVSTLNCNRNKGIGVPYIKMGRLVRYRKSDVDAYLAACEVEVGSGSTN